MFAIRGLASSARLAPSPRFNSVRARRVARQYRSNTVVRAQSIQEPEVGEKKSDEVDIYRDTPLRYMGYANECGEAFAAWLPPIGVPASYGVAALYVMADTADKGSKAYEAEEGDDGAKLKRAAAVSLDTFTWQMLASVFWPGSFIRCVVAATNVVVTHLPLPAAEATAGVDIERLLPTLAGLFTIPLIVKPIDKTIDEAMEMSVSKVLNGKMEGPADYGIAAGVIAACLAVPPTLFNVAAGINGLAA